MAATNKHIGSSLDDALTASGDLTDVNAAALKRVIAWEVRQKMQAEQLSKTKMAALMKTSRSALDRLLDPANTSVTLHTLDNAARAIGKTLHIELV